MEIVLPLAAIVHRGLIQVHGDLVAGLQRFAESLGEFAGIEFAGGDAIAEEDAGEALGEHQFAFGRAQGNGRVLARTAAAEIASGNDNRIGAVHFAVGHKAVGIERFRQPAKRVAAQLKWDELARGSARQQHLERGRPARRKPGMADQAGRSPRAWHRWQAEARSEFGRFSGRDARAPGCRCAQLVLEPPT